MIDFIVKNRTAVILATALMSAAGLFAWHRMPIDAFPDATNQQVMILTAADGLGPVDVERQVTIPVESAMGGLPHVTMVRSTSKTSLSQVVVIFEDHVGTWFARQLVSERLSMIAGTLPAGAIPKMGPATTGLGEVFQYTLESPERTLTELRTMQDRIVAPRLRSISGVNEVNSFGGKVRQVEVLLDPNRLAAFGIAPTDVVEALAADNANVTGGFIVRGWEQENVRTVGLFGDIEEIGKVVLKSENGIPVTNDQVAAIVEGSLPRFGAVTRDGRGEAVAGMVIMLQGENAAEVVGRVRAALPSIRQALPADVEINVYYDRVELVDAVIGTIQGALLQGGLLVILLLFLLLGSLRSAVVTAISIPVTTLGAFILMKAAGLSANLMTIGGLAIAIGIVVDGPIVVVENVVRRVRQSGNAPTTRTIVSATAEVARPILFSMLIILIVFVPLFTLDGMAGKMFGPLALTMVLSMAVSIVVTLVVTPAVLAAVRLPRGATASSSIVSVLSSAYGRSLDFTFRHRWLPLTVSAVGLAAGIAVLPGLGMEFLPRLDEGALAINVVRLPNAGLDGSVATADYLEDALTQFPEVRAVVSKTGRAEISEDPMGPEQTDIMVMLHPESEWNSGRTPEQLVEAIRQKLQAVPGIRLAFSQPIALRVNELVSGVKSDLAVKIFGLDIESLKSTADRVADEIRSIPGAADVNVEQVAGFSQIDIVPDRQEMARHGLRIGDINGLVGTAVGGTVATEMIDGQASVPVSVRMAQEYRSDPDTIMNLLLRTPAGNDVRLGSVASARGVEGPAQISREGFTRRVVVEVNVSGRDLGGFVSDVRTALAPVVAGLPEGYWLDLGGTWESQQRAMSRLAIVIPLSILLIFMLLVAAQQSVRSAFLVLANLPFAVVGGLISMAIFKIPFNVPATIGFIALFGVAVQNGMVLLAFERQLRDSGQTPAQAMKAACLGRVRPLLMTALTTSFGLIPMIWASGPGADVERPLAIVMNGGVITSTILTLFILPSIHVMVMERKSVPAKIIEK